MSGPGDKDWERRRAIIHGEQPKSGKGAKEGETEPANGFSTAETGSSPSFTGDGPAGESISGGVAIGTGEDTKDAKSKD